MRLSALANWYNHHSMYNQVQRYFGDEAQLGQLVAKIKDALKRSGQLV